MMAQCILELLPVSPCIMQAVGAKLLGPGFGFMRLLASHLRSLHHGWDAFVGGRQVRFWMLLSDCLFAAFAFHGCHCYRVTLEAKPGLPAPVRQAAVLYDLWLLDVPKLLDLAALYGTGSPKLVHRLMQQVMGADSAPVLCHLLTWQLCMHSSWCTACCSMSAADFSSVPPVAAHLTCGSILLCCHDKSSMLLTDRGYFPAGTYPAQLPRLSAARACCRRLPCSPTVCAAACMMGTSNHDSSAPLGQTLPLQVNDIQGGDAMGTP